MAERGHGLAQTPAQSGDSMRASGRSPLLADEDGVITLSFLLLPDYAMVSLLSAIEPLRIANRLSGRTLYRWQCLSEGGQSILASNGMALQQHLDYRQVATPRNLFVNASFYPERHGQADTLRWLRQLRQQHSLLGALDTGCYLLAKAGLLHGRRVTLHWEAAPIFQALFPQVQVTSELYEIERNLISCAGGTAATDLMLQLIEQDYGSSLCAQICDQQIRSGMRLPSERQRANLPRQLFIQHPRLIRALELMELHLQHPLSPETLAQRAHLSLRQLERLCQRFLQSSPSQYYLGLRLQRAQQLLQQSDLPVAAIAAAAGFTSASHFCRSYRRHFGQSPGSSRAQLNPGAPAPESARAAHPGRHNSPANDDAPGASQRHDGHVAPGDYQIPADPLG